MANIHTTDTALHKIMMALMEKVDVLDAKLSKMFAPTLVKDEQIWLNVSELQAYLPSHPKKQTIYSWTSNRKIPFHKKGRSIMFDKAEIDAWLLDSEHFSTKADLMREAQEFVYNKNSKKRY